jgi:hypothetical protein
MDNKPEDKKVNAGSKPVDKKIDAGSKMGDVKATEPIDQKKDKSKMSTPDKKGRSKRIEASNKKDGPRQVSEKMAGKDDEQANVKDNATNRQKSKVEIKKGIMSGEERIKVKSILEEVDDKSKASSMVSFRWSFWI